jgi:2-polyprenyl-3-methyl-5-hydroxy-6-metoxy-1,4-benzoquinol methylase
MSGYTQKPQDYFTNIRQDVICMIPRGKGGAVLEIGAGGCDTLCELKSSGVASRVVGIELMEIPESNQQNPLVDELHIGMVEDVLSGLKNESFDVIICADVLEHLADPWSVISAIREKLSKDGVLIVSMPNIRNIKILWQIAVLGDFRYVESGILDKTHLRFFCKKNIEELCTKNGFETLSHRASMGLKAKIPSLLTLGLFENFFARQHIFSFKKSND